jgi:hypothetical protein
MLEKLGASDCRVLIDLVGRIMQGGAAKAQAARVIEHISEPGLRLIRKAHAEGVVDFAVRLWVNAGNGRGGRAFRAAVAGAFVPTYRREAARRLEEVLDVSRVDQARAGKVVDVEYEVKP